MMIRNFLILTVLAALVPTAMSNVSASADSEIALFSTASVDPNGLSVSGNGDSAKMELKATNDNGKSNRVSGFQLAADNVLSIEVGDKVTTDARNNQKAIGITSNGVIDFAGYTQGVYTLNVVVDDDRAYEAIIVIGGQTQESIKSVNKEIIFEIYNGNNTGGNKTGGGSGSNITSGGSGGSGSNMTENGNFAGSGGDGGSNMTQGITEFATVPEPVNPCIEDPQSEECEQIRSQSCDALGCPGYPILEPEPEPTNPVEPIGSCFDGATPVDGRCPAPDPEGTYCHALGCPGSPPHVEPDPGFVGGEPMIPDTEPIIFPDNSVESPTEGIDCELQPELCEENIVEIPEEEELTEGIETEDKEEEEEVEEESSDSEDSEESGGSEPSE
jgi:hypothetical protein